jgi:hypothetical protein
MQQLPNLRRNIALFTIGLFIVTLGVEYFKKGHLNIEQPLLFFIAILALGAFGGYMVSWVAAGNK